jgi:hypothetical protein
VYVKKIELTNVKSFDRFEWGLPPGVPAAGWHVLLGDNGSGKSSLLGACAAALLGDKEALALRLKLNLADWVTRGESEGRIVLTLEQDPQWDGWSGKGRTSAGDLEAGIRIGADDALTPVGHRPSPDRHVWGGGKGWFSAAFGPFRRFTGGSPEYAKLFNSNPKLARHLSIFGEDVALTETLSWLKQLRFEQLEQGGIDRRSGHPETVDSETFDCFLSHDSRDKPAVRALAKTLREREISVWLDEEQLRPGRPWQPQFESAIRASRSVAVLVGADGLGPWEEEEMHVALALAVEQDLPVIPVLLADAPTVPELPRFIEGRTWVDLRPNAEPGSLPALERLIWGITGKRPNRNDVQGQTGASGRSDGDDLLDAIKAFVNQPDFLPNDTRLSEVNSKEVVFLDGNGYRVPIESLSDGFRSILSMTLELIRQLAEAYGTRKVFGDENTRVIPPGVVLIDEVDVHLHPRWQRLVGPWLTDHFPNMQFLVTTHSPLVCQGAEKGSVTRLPQPGTDDRGGPITGAALNRLVYGDILEALSSGAFGDEVGRSDTGEEKLEQLARLNVKALREGLTPSEQDERRALQEIFGGNANLMETDGAADSQG